MPLYITAQAIGIAAMGANVASYQFKKGRQILLLQLIGSALCAVNMLMLGAMMGGLLNLVGIARSIVYMRLREGKKHSPLVEAVFISLYLLSYALTFTVLGKSPTVTNLIVELLPVLGMTAFTIGAALGSARTIRLFGFISSPCWLIYNIVSLAVGGILCEVFALISNLSAFLRYDLRRKK